MSSSSEILPRGITCECGTFYKFGVYAYTHFDVKLTHTCKKCGAVHGLLQGVSTLLKEETK